MEAPDSPVETCVAGDRSTTRTPERSDLRAALSRAHRESERKWPATGARGVASIGAREARPARRDARFASFREPRGGVDRKGGSAPTVRAGSPDSRVNRRGGSGTRVGGSGAVGGALGDPVPTPSEVDPGLLATGVGSANRRDRPLWVTGRGCRIGVGNLSGQASTGHLGRYGAAGREGRAGVGGLGPDARGRGGAGAGASSECPRTGNGPI